MSVGLAVEGMGRELRLERSRKASRAGMARGLGQSQHFFSAENTYETFFDGTRRFVEAQKCRWGLRTREWDES